MDDLRALFMDVFGERVPGPPADDDIVFGRDSRFNLQSMDTLRFASALLPRYGDKVYDIRVEDVSSLRSIHEQLTRPV